MVSSRSSSRSRLIYVFSISVNRASTAPDVLAALCSKRKSALTDLWLCVGVVEPMEDSSVLERRILREGQLTTFTLTGCQNLGLVYPPLYIAAVQEIIHSSGPTLSSFNLDSPHVEPFLDSPASYFEFPNLREVTVWDDCLGLPCFRSRNADVTTLRLHLRTRDPLFDDDAMWSLARRFPSVKAAFLYLDDGALNVRVSVLGCSKPTDVSTRPKSSPRWARRSCST